MHKRRYERLLCCIFGVAASVGFAGVEAACAQDMAYDEKPWALRDHYKVPMGGFTVYYGVDNAGWAMMAEDGSTVIEHANHAIVLADGTAITRPRGPHGDTVRLPFTTPLGAGTRYEVALPTQDGFAIKHSIAIHQTRPFVLFEMEITNTGDSPKSIAAIHPIVIAPGHMPYFDDGASVAQRRLHMHGPYPVYDKSRPPLLAVFSKQEAVVAAMGPLPDGKAEVGSVFQTDSGRWYGKVQSVYNPPVELAPGESLRAAPVWFSYSLPNPSDLDLYYAWSHSTRPHQIDVLQMPDAWVTAAMGESAADLVRVARAWAGMGVRHALVPGDWEGKPGTLKGAAPRYPRQLSSLAAELSALGVQLGVTVDPTATEGGDDAWAVTTADGLRWLNLSVPEARAHAAGQLRSVVRDGAAFLVIAPPAIPDAVLAQFGMTRAEAYEMAFEAARHAAAGKPVLPPSATTLGGSVTDWQDAQTSTARMRDYRVTLGPIRLDAAQVGNTPPEWAAAVAGYAGPIEFTGEPARSVVSALDPHFPRPRFEGDTGRGRFAQPVPASEGE